MACQAQESFFVWAATQYSQVFCDFFKRIHESVLADSASISRSIVFICGMCGVLVLRTRFLNGGFRGSHAGIPASGAASS
jgi:hypothetical protein